MATEDEDIMRCLSPWLLRAEEVSGADARVAYYLRVKAMQEGLRLGATGDPRGRGGPRCAGVLKALMGTLESDKGRAGLQGAAADGAHVAQFASKVFERADARDRGGVCTADTAQAFAAAALFFELLRDFGELEEAAAAKQRYAAWRSADLAATLRGAPTAPAPAPAAPAAQPAPEAEPLSGEAAWTPAWGGEGLCVGDRALYRSNDGEGEDSAAPMQLATVLAVDDTVQPRAFLVALSGGGERSTAGERLALAPTPAARRPSLPRPEPPTPPPTEWTQEATAAESCGADGDPEEASMSSPRSPGACDGDGDVAQSPPGSVLSHADSLDVHLTRIRFLSDNEGPTPGGGTPGCSSPLPPHLHTWSTPSTPPPSPPMPPMPPPPPPAAASSPPSAPPQQPPPPGRVFASPATAVAAAAAAAPLSLPGESAGRDAASAAASVLVRAQADAAAAAHHLRLDDVPEATRDLRAALALLNDAFPHLCDGA